LIDLLAVYRRFSNRDLRRSRAALSLRRIDLANGSNSCCYTRAIAHQHLAISHRTTGRIQMMLNKKESEQEQYQVKNDQVTFHRLVVRFIVWVT
jgi:hypothetical protein